MKVQLANCVGALVYLGIGGQALYFCMQDHVFFHLLRMACCCVFATVFLIRRKASQSDTSLMNIVISLGHTMLPLAMVATFTQNYLMRVGMALCISGLFLSTVSALHLWDSFGILPAYRGLKIHGPYRIIRHPIYSGYVMTVIGMLFLAPTLYNLSVALSFLFVTHARIQAEEKFLQLDPTYSHYQAVVRHKLLPGIY